MPDSFGLERAIEPRHALAQQAWKLDNTMTLRPDEVLIDVKIINVNLVSFNEILDETGGDDALVCRRVLEIIHDRGKLHNRTAACGSWGRNIPTTSTSSPRTRSFPWPPSP